MASPSSPLPTQAQPACDPPIPPAPPHLCIDHEVPAAGGAHGAQPREPRGHRGLDAQRGGAGVERGAQLLKEPARRLLAAARRGQLGERDLLLWCGGDASGLQVQQLSEWGEGGAGWAQGSDTEQMHAQGRARSGRKCGTAQGEHTAAAQRSRAPAPSAPPCPHTSPPPRSRCRCRARPGRQTGAAGGRAPRAGRPEPGRRRRPRPAPLMQTGPGACTCGRGGAGRGRVEEGRQGGSAQCTALCAHPIATQAPPRQTRAGHGGAPGTHCAGSSLCGSPQPQGEPSSGSPASSSSCRATLRERAVGVGAQHRERVSGLVRRWAQVDFGLR